MSFSFAGQACKLRCPKCRKQNLNLSEVWDGNGIYFSVRNGVMPKEADDHFQGAPVAVQASCADCDHGWRVRGVRAFADLAIDPDEEPA